MDTPDIRWLQRFANFKKALLRIGEVVDNNSIYELSELEKEGLIQRFEYTYELAWKTLQDLSEAKGYTDVAGPKPVIAQSFKNGYLDSGETWIRMKKSRELTSHTYNAETAAAIVENIYEAYYSQFLTLEKRLEVEKYKTLEVL